jgi:hypothetical protein
VARVGTQNYRCSEDQILDYASCAPGSPNHLKPTDLPEVVNDAILEDLIHREGTVILPIAREFAAVSQHPLAGAIDAFVKEAEKADLP